MKSREKSTQAKLKQNKYIQFVQDTDNEAMDYYDRAL